MLELAPGVYTAPRISQAVRNRIWNVLSEWYSYENDASIVMLWADNTYAGGQAVCILGSPPIELVEIDGLLTARRPLSLKS
jgi:CRISPR-associated protein Cas2